MVDHQHTLVTPPGAARYGGLVLPADTRASAGSWRPLVHGRCQQRSSARLRAVGGHRRCGDVDVRAAMCEFVASQHAQGRLAVLARCVLLARGLVLAWF